MSDRRLYHDDPDLARVVTRVIETGERDGHPWARLEETPFYPEGGGQPADRGRLGAATVVDVQAEGDRILHLLDRPAAVGPVEALLDVERRWDHRQQHTAQHLLTAILAERHGLPTTSFHLGASYAAVEVDGRPPEPARLAGIEREVNEEILRDRPVTCRWVEPEALAVLPVRTRGLPEGHRGPVRLVEIEGIDLNTCGGTHVPRLGAIQVVHLIDAEPARGGARIRFLAGGRVLREMRRLEGAVAEVQARVGTGADEFSRVLDGWQAERRGLERRVRELESEEARRVAAELARSAPGPIVRVLPGAGPDFLRKVAAAVLASRDDALVVLLGATETCCFLVQSGPAGPPDVAALGERVRAAVGGRGGGRGRVYQGRDGRAALGEDALRALVTG